MTALDASTCIVVGALFAAAAILLAVVIWDGIEAAGLDGDRGEE